MDSHSGGGFLLLEWDQRPYCGNLSGSAKRDFIGHSGLTDGAQFWDLSDQCRSRPKAQTARGICSGGANINPQGNRLVAPGVVYNIRIPRLHSWVRIHNAICVCYSCLESY